ncbi:uncharacterized protein ASPGLDRAFT_84359, partial [Aspergillus glaucus CBS 516.65]
TAAPKLPRFSLYHRTGGTCLIGPTLFLITITIHSTSVRAVLPSLSSLIGRRLPFLHLLPLLCTLLYHPVFY